MTRTHGLGSGIYGVTTPDERENETMTPIQLHNPIIIENDEIDSDLTTVSIWLIDMVEQKIKLGQLQGRLRTADTSSITDIQEQIDFENQIFNRLKSQEQLTEIINTTNHLLGDKYDAVDIKCKLFGAINGFIKDYAQAKRGDFLLQPINYLLLSYDYDGIYNASSSGNTFARGSVAFRNINIRDQKQAFGSPYLQPGNKLRYNGSILDECTNSFDSTSPRRRRSQRQPTILRVKSRSRSRSRSRDRVGSKGGSKKKLTKNNKRKRIRRRTLRKNKH
jgi:hypothetical protein